MYKSFQKNDHESCIEMPVRYRHAIKTSGINSLSSLCGSIAVLFMLVVVAPYLWELCEKEDVEIEDIKDD
jgi:hypothetical protein